MGRRRCRIKGVRIIYSPFIEGRAASDWDAQVTDRERANFILTHVDLLPETRLLSRHVGFEQTAPHRPATPQGRIAYQQRLRSWAETVVSTSGET